VTKNVFSIYSLDGIVFVNFLRQPSVENFLNAIDDVALCDQNRLRLWDVTCGIKLTSAQVRAIARYEKIKVHDIFLKGCNYCSGQSDFWTI
jgi:hypothetical protein